MSKIIKVTPEIAEEARRDFEKVLAIGKFADGRLSFTKDFTKIQRNATVFFTPLAWAKMLALINGFSDEVAWHGVAHRGDDPTKDEYIISDILVYPQEVTGSTVTTDQTGYEEFLAGLDDDTFNNLRFQGHSHVNMGVSASPTDVNLLESILAQLESSMFYIFMIWNKRLEFSAKIYDLAKNVLFETSDVEVKIVGQEGLADFMKDAKAVVKRKQYTTPATSPYYNSHGISGSSGGYPSVLSKANVNTPYNPATATPATAKASAVTKPMNSAGKTGSESGTKSSKKKESEKPRTRLSGKVLDQMEFDDDYPTTDELYDHFGGRC